jgi:hypothetical protein
MIQEEHGYLPTPWFRKNMATSPPHDSEKNMATFLPHNSGKNLATSLPHDFFL